MNSTTVPLWCKVPRFEISKDAQIDIPAYGGRMDVRWDPGTKVTASGGLAYLAVFLKTTGFLDSLCSDFPIDYRSNNSCSKREIVCTMVLAILYGKNRYVQINALRNDAAAMELLGIKRIVSEDTVRRALRDADADAEAIRDSLTLIGKFLEWVDPIAEQLKPNERWTLILMYAFRKLLRFGPHRSQIPTLLPA